MTRLRAPYVVVDSSEMFVPPPPPHLQGPKVEHPNAPIRPGAREHVLSPRERYIVDLLIVRNKLCFNLLGGNVPYGAGCVYGGGTD